MLSRRERCWARSCTADHCTSGEAPLSLGLDFLIRRVGLVLQP